MTAGVNLMDCAGAEWVSFQHSSGYCTNASLSVRCETLFPFHSSDKVSLNIHLNSHSNDLLTFV